MNEKEARVGPFLKKHNWNGATVASTQTVRVRIHWHLQFFLSNLCLKRAKINKKRVRGWPIKKQLKRHNFVKANFDLSPRQDFCRRMISVNFANLFVPFTVRPRLVKSDRWKLYDQQHRQEQQQKHRHQQQQQLHRHQQGRATTKRTLPKPFACWIFKGKARQCSIRYFVPKYSLANQF